MHVHCTIGHEEVGTKGISSSSSSSAHNRFVWPGKGEKGLTTERKKRKKKKKTKWESVKEWREPTRTMNAQRSLNKKIRLLSPSNLEILIDIFVWLLCFIQKLTLILPSGYPKNHCVPCAETGDRAWPSQTMLQRALSCPSTSSPFPLSCPNFRPVMLSLSHSEWAETTKSSPPPLALKLAATEHDPSQKEEDSS